MRSLSTAAKVKKSHEQYLKNEQLTFALVPDVAAVNAFDDAVKGVDGVIHTASPFVLSVEDNERDLLTPALNGTTEILNSVQKHAPQVKRVVLTSSFAAIVDLSKGARPGYTYDEKDWNPVTYEEAKKADGGAAYCASKTFAERAAWDFVKDKKPNFDVATICPPMIYGPLDHDASLKHLNTSSADIYRFMNGSQKEPGPTAFPAFADVRDVAEAHLRAYEREGNGERYLITGGSFQYPDVCQVILDTISGNKDKITDPKNTEKIEVFSVDAGKAQKELDMKFRAFEECIGDTVKSLERLQKAKATA